MIAGSLYGKGALRAGLSQARATDIMWAVANPRTYLSLVTERHWTVEEYERWLDHLLAASLLAEP